MTTPLHGIYERFIQPRSTNPDVRRREFILSVLLGGLCAVAIPVTIAAYAHHFVTDAVHDAGSVLVIPLCLAGLIALYWLARQGRSRPVGLLLVSLVAIMALYFVYTWSFELPITVLLFSLSIVLAGVLFAAYAAILASALATLILLVVAQLEVTGTLHPNVSWLSVKPDFADAVGDAAIFMIIGLVTWLANTEIDRSLTRARASEASLAEERDSLEVKVKERTAELENAHLVRLMELQRFAELGRLAAGLLHDVSSPLTVATLNVGQLRAEYQPSVVRQVAQSLQHIERYVVAARNQLVAGSATTTFSVKREIAQVLSILSHSARKHGVRLRVDVPAVLQLTGDAIKFNQVALNLILNAIEAYDDVPRRRPAEVRVQVEATTAGAKLVVHDFGRGVTAKEKELIFQSFYTTKIDKDRNMGIGLSLVKQIVEEDFGGKLTVASSPRRGTTFTATFYNQKAG